MAGIGFELKKLFQKKGVLNTTKAYGYAAIICAGPMLLGVILLLGIMMLCNIFDTLRNTDLTKRRVFKRGSAYIRNRFGNRYISQPLAIIKRKAAYILQ